MVYIGTREYKLDRMCMSHMAADSLDELHTMAEIIGVERRHFQDKPGLPHYDICKQKKASAIKAGAMLVNDREIVRLLKANNAQ
jgi:hypothetical protein